MGDESIDGLGAAVAVCIDTPAGVLTGAVHLPGVVPAPVVVCCHGLQSSKESSKFILIGQELSRAGMVVVRFDFSGCGESRASLEWDLITSRLRDLRHVLEYVQHQSWSGGSIGLLGSSFGGFLSLLMAGTREFSIGAVVTLAAPFDLLRIKLSRQESESARAAYPSGFTLGEPKDLASIAPVSRVLIIHGQQDETVPWTDSLDIYRQVSDPRQLLLMRTGDHRFLDQESRRLAVRASCNWLKDHLGISMK